ncbi:MAG: ROK family protein [Clostridia bacterium]|nr:ROK family protein [Clostridia bacterium]
MYYIGIDLGGTGIKAGIVDEQGNIILKDSCPTGAERGYGAVIQDMANLAISVVEKSGHRMSEIKAIGIGLPGVMDPRTGRVPFCTNLGWHDVPIIQEMAKYTDRPVFVDNDATVAGLAESVAGVSAGCANSLFITLGTGVGGGVIIGGKVFSGSHGVASEIGHMVVVADGEMCTCGMRGCWERYASATALIREGRKLCANNPDTALAKAVDGDLKAITAKHVIDLAKQGDPDCAALFDRYVYYLCLGLRNMVSLYDPEVIALGGGVSHAGEFLLNAVRAKLPGMVFYRDMPFARVELAKLTNDAGIIGAAMLGR